MTYLDLAAEEIRRHVPEKLLPDGDTELLFRLYAVLLLAKGADVTTVDVHNAWSAWMQMSHPDHQSLRPFEELDPETQSADEPYAEAMASRSETPPTSMPSFSSSSVSTTIPAMSVSSRRSSSDSKRSGR